MAENTMQYIVTMEVDENIVPQILDLDPRKILRDLAVMKHGLPTGTFRIDEVLSLHTSYVLKLLGYGNIKVLADFEHKRGEMIVRLRDLRDLDFYRERTKFSRTFQM